MPLLRSWGVSAQVGFEALQSDFNTDRRNQFFFTTGLFHRPVCCQGLQGGLVFDWLHDDVRDSFDVAQLRGEVSWLCDCHNEVGFDSPPA